MRTRPSTTCRTRLWNNSPKIGHDLLVNHPRRFDRNASISMEREARAPVRARQGVGEEAGPLDETRQGNRRAYRQQGARPRRRDEGTRLAHGDARHVLRSSRWASLRDEPAEGADEGTALQRGQAPEHRGALADDEGP